MEHRTQQRIVVLAPLALLATMAPAGQTDTTYGIDVVTGYDSNPLRVMDDGPGGAYSALRLDGGLTRFAGSGSTVAFFLSGHAATRLDGSATADAGEDSGDAKAGLAYSPRFTGHRLVISTGGRLSAFRGTFTDRTSGEIYEATVFPATVPATSTPIPDRLNYDSAGAFFKLRWKQGRRLTLFVETSLDRTDFVEDYQTTTNLDSLDYEAVAIRPGAKVQVGDVATLSLFVSLTDLDYDDRPALDDSGTEVPGTQRAYEYTQYGFTVAIKPSASWKLDLGLANGGRDDTYAGYYDSFSTSGFLAIGRDLGKRNRLRLYASMREVDYDHATVTGDPLDNDIRANEDMRYAARFSHTFGERLRWFFEGGQQQSDSNDPVFAYDRDWVLTGIHYGR